MDEPSRIFARQAVSLLEIEGLSLTYRTASGDIHALDDVSLSLPRGRAMGLVGESGSGKSSVVLAMLGLSGPNAKVTARKALYDGRDLIASAPLLRGRQLGLVFQDSAAALNPAIQVGRQVAEPLVQHRKLGWPEALDRAEALLKEVGIRDAGAVLRAYPHQLSGGMKQRAVIAGALASEPDLLLLDEPTTALDVTVEAQIMDLLDELRARRGLSMLFVSHNLGVVDRICDDLTVLYGGRVVEQGEIDQVLHNPRHPYTKGLLAALPRIEGNRKARLVPIAGRLPSLFDIEPGCNFLPRCPFAAAGCEAPQTLVAAGGHAALCHRAAQLVGRPWPRPDGEAPSVAGKPPATSLRPTPEPIVLADRLVKRYTLGGPRLSFSNGFPKLSTPHPFLAVNGVTLRIDRGQVLGLVGESGSGKSTVGRILLRLIPASAGALSFDGVPVPDAPPLAFRRRAQIVFQNSDSSLNPRRTVEEVLRRSLQRFGAADARSIEIEIDHLLDLVRLTPACRQRFPHQMSGGEKQRIGIARALAGRPDFVVCDEAVSALDVSVQAAILNLLSDLRDELGVAYLFITHDIGVVAHIADRIAVMYRGQIVEEGAAADIIERPAHTYTQTLLAAVPRIGQHARSGRPPVLPAQI